jgi:hypothetical protein
MQNSGDRQAAPWSKVNFSEHELDDRIQRRRSRTSEKGGNGWGVEMVSGRTSLLGDCLSRHPQLVLETLLSFEDRAQCLLLNQDTVSEAFERNLAE